MKIETGTPRAAGRYVCYMHGVDVAGCIRLWTGEGWANLNGQAVAGTVAGWIGPLPLNTAAAKAARSAPTEFDL